MSKYVEIFLTGYEDYARYLWDELTHPHWKNYVCWLIGVSLFFFLLELLRPWRRNQPRFRKDFWLDAFYMFFNFFLFSLIIYNAASDAVVNAIGDALRAIGVENLVAIEIRSSVSRLSPPPRPRCSKRSETPPTAWSRSMNVSPSWSPLSS